MKKVASCIDTEPHLLAENMDLSIKKAQVELEFSDAQKDSSGITLGEQEGLETWVVPHSIDTSYLTHGYYRYIGKFPPQIAAKLIDDYYPGKGKILDPMVGGGTVLIESVLRSIECEGWDINPVSLLVSRCVSRSVNASLFEKCGQRIIHGLAVLNGERVLISQDSEKWEGKGLNLKYCQEYFDDNAKAEIEYALHVVEEIFKEDEEVSDLLLLIILASLRRISFANVKKMNLELDFRKKTRISLFQEFSRRFYKIAQTNRNLPSVFGVGLSEVYEKNAMKWDSDKKYGMILIHPPYLTNTAFSESTQLQLAILNVRHQDIWKKELRCRGSFLKETNGLQKYLVNWAKVIKSASESLEKGGFLAIVVGDGQIDYVRIPVGTISVEFGRDVGLRLVKRSFHLLNNNTGQTQNRKMRGQHVIVFEKS